MKVLVKTFLITCLSFSLKGSHIVGGDIYYDYLGNDQYQIYLNLYIDCQTGNPAAINQDNKATIGIFKTKSNSLFKSITLSKRRTVSVKKMNYNCLDTPSNVCVDKFEFYTVVSLPDIEEGYTVSYQRCCRNRTILNVQNPGATGATYFVKIPERKILGNNSSPRFKRLPPNFLCLHKPFRFLHNATDPDGDSLAYELVVPFDGASTAIPRPAVPSKPPYKNIQLLAPYSKDFLISAGPPLWIDSTTGFIKSIPRRFGQYSVGIAVKEYRDGQLLSTVVRDFQFNVIGCSFDLISAFVNPIQDCDLDVEFENKSQGATNYFWDFGDLNSLTDTSTLSNPSYKYPGTGTYQIKLIATSPTCSDTFYKTLRVNPDTGDFAGVDVRSCNGEPIIIGPEKHQKNASYNWSPGHLVSDSTKRKTMVVPTKSFQVILTQRFGYCLGYDSVNILFGKPSLALTIDTFDECEKRAYQFKSEKEGDSITWRLISDDGIEVYNGKKWIKQFKSKGNYQLTMMAKINDECTDSLTESLKIQFDSLNFLGLDKSICFGDSVLIGDTFNHTNVNYTWFPKSKFDDTTISILFVKPKYNAVYWLKKSSKNCELIDTLKIEVDKPEPDFKIAYDAPCDGSSVTFYNESENCENYYWDFGKNNGELPVTTKDSVNVEYNQNKTYTIALRGISQKGCSFTKNKELNIANDTAFFAGTDTSLCKGDSIYIGYFDSISYTIFMWYKNDTFLNYAKPKIKVSPYDTAEYVLLKKYSDCTFADTVKVDVENPKAIFSIDYEPECDVFEVPILNRSKGIKSRFWLFINQDSSHAEFTKTRLTLTQGEGIYDLSIVVYSNNCTDTFNEQLIAYLDTGVVIQSDSTLCLGDSIELSIADTNKNANYLWLPNQYLNSNTISNPTAKPTTSIEYLVKRSFEKCVYTKTIDLNVVNPKASFDTIISPDCFGYKVDFKNLSTESNQYLWTFNNDSVSDNLEQTVVFNYGDSINANLTAINEHCASEFSISDFKDGYTRFAVTIPNIFTPNDDDRNDCFKINVPALPKDCNNYGLAIYNRWGQMVFSNKNLKGDFCWDGTNQPNSAHLQSGVYFYIIDILDRKYTGSVHLIR